MSGRRNDRRFSVTRSQLSCARLDTDPQRRRYGRCVREFSYARYFALQRRLTELNEHFCSGVKRNAVLFLANETLRIYFHVRRDTSVLFPGPDWYANCDSGPQLKNPRMGNTVVKNTGDAPNRLEDYPKADQVAFLYYTGRMSLFEMNLRRVRVIPVASSALNVDLARVGRRQIN